MSESTIATDPKSQAMIALFAHASAADAERQALLDDPLAALASIGIEPDERHRDAVAQSLKTVLLAQMPPAAERMAAKRAANDFEKHVHVSVELWGVVIRIDHAAINELPRGRDAIKPLADGIAAAMTASSALGPAALVIFGAAAIWATVLTAYVLVLPAIDQGKGIYLTVTWPQVVMAVGSGGILGAAMMPIPTAVV